MRARWWSCLGEVLVSCRRNTTLVHQSPVQTQTLFIISITIISTTTAAEDNNVLGTKSTDYQQLSSAVTSTAEQNRSTSPTAAAARPIITSRTCYTSQNRIAYIFINYLFFSYFNCSIFSSCFTFFSVTSSALTDVEKSKHQTQFSVIVFFLPQTFSSF